jgi:hypothetical protein
MSGQSNEHSRGYILLVAIIGIIVIVFDGGVMLQPNLGSLNTLYTPGGVAWFFFKKNGYIFRGLYIFAVLILSYSELMSMRRRENKTERIMELITYLLVFLLFGTLYVVSDLIPFEKNVKNILYIIGFIGGSISAVLLGKNISSKPKVAITSTNLGSDNKRMVDDKIFWFKTNDGYINIINPFQGIFVNGGAGAGKSASIAHPVIVQMIENEWTGVVYDFKFFDLTNVVYTAYRRKKEQFKNIPFKVINFTDLKRSHRVNPLNPLYLKDEAFIEEYVTTILKNLNKEWIKKSDFFVTSAILLLKAVVIFFKNNHPEYCDLPHVVCFCNNATAEEVVNTLKVDKMAKAVASSVSEAVEKGAMEQVAGVLGSLKAELQKLENKNFYWVLGGDDVNLDLNNKEKRGMLCVVNDQQKTDTISPLISLIITVARKMMNVKNREKSIFLLDEAPTLYLPKFEELPSTGRSNKICAMYMGQDISQMDSMYGKDARRNILGSLGNTFFGNATEGETLKYISEFFGKEDRVVENSSIGSSKSAGNNSKSENISFNIQERQIIKPQDVASLKIGEFCGKIVGRENSFYKARFKMLVDYPDGYGIDPEGYEVPEFNKNVTPEIVEMYYEKVYEEVKNLISNYNP